MAAEQIYNGPVSLGFCSISLVKPSSLTRLSKGFKVTPTLKIGLVGDQKPDVIAHRAIPKALDLAAKSIGVDVAVHWLPTESIENEAVLSPYDALWCVPASPYRSLEGALLAIKWARETSTPFLGTCGGFQHAVLEYARNKLGWAEATHAEVSDVGEHNIISALACSLVDVAGEIRLAPGSRIWAAYGAETVSEDYRCSYAVNEVFAERLFADTLKVSGVDETGAVRAVELDEHPFFVATLFQPERVALKNIAPPIAVAFLRAVAEARVTGASVAV